MLKDNAVNISIILVAIAVISTALRLIAYMDSTEAWKHSVEERLK
jgi:hypothetical protein